MPLACAPCFHPAGSEAGRRQRSRARRKNWFTLVAGALGCSLLFYVATNTTSWWRDPYYLKTTAGWWQALTIGHPEYPPTIWFFRNTLASDLLFTAGFALTMEFAALRRGAASLLTKRAVA